MEITCPKCSETFPVESVASIPDRQTIGKTILNMESLQRNVAKDLGFKVCVFIESIDLQPHKIKIGFTIATVK